MAAPQHCHPMGAIPGGSHLEGGGGGARTDVGDGMIKVDDDDSFEQIQETEAAVVVVDNDDDGQQNKDEVERQMSNDSALEMISQSSDVSMGWGEERAAEVTVVGEVLGDSARTSTSGGVDDDADDGERKSGGRQMVEVIADVDGGDQRREEFCSPSDRTSRKC